MDIRFAGLRVVLLALCVLSVPAGSDHYALGQEKDPIKALFDGVPADLQAKVKTNPVRCDRVNDWLAEHVNGKGKSIEMRLEVSSVGADRSDDGTYLVRLRLKYPTVTVLGDEWYVSLATGKSTDDFRGGPFQSQNQLAFVGVKTADAEKVADAQHVMVQGKVKDVKVPRTLRFAGKGAGPSTSVIAIWLDDVQVDGKKWTPYQEPGFGAPFGGENFAPKKGKSKKGAPPEDK